MVHAKNYETVLKFVKVMPKKLVASFFWTRCSYDKSYNITTSQVENLQQTCDRPYDILRTNLTTIC